MSGSTAMAEDPKGRRAYRETRQGKRYPFETLAALTYGVGTMLDMLRDQPAKRASSLASARVA